MIDLRGLSRYNLLLESKASCGEHKDKVVVITGHE
jgi:hypothetical protein